MGEFFSLRFGGIGLVSPRADFKGGGRVDGVLASFDGRPGEGDFVVFFREVGDCGCFFGSTFPVNGGGCWDVVWRCAGGIAEVVAGDVIGEGWGAIGFDVGEVGPGSTGELGGDAEADVVFV